MKAFIFCLVVWVLVGCKEKYEPPVDAPILGYLVIEGFIDPGGGSEMRLTRTIPLNDTARLINERSAQVQVEGSDGSKVNLPETGIGVYTTNQLALKSNLQYRLYIKTREGKEYASDFVPVRTAPPIDSVTWTREDDGVRIYVNTHDPQNNTRYYRWETEETWEFHSLVGTNLEYVVNPTSGIITGVKYRKPDQSVDSGLYRCWQVDNSRDLILGSTEKLSEDRIRMPVVFIPDPDWKLSVLYSVKVNQYALTKPEYDFLQIMKRNSEETGSIFDPQPSELKGNIHCLSNPTEPVIGFIGITNRPALRLFIRNSEVVGWNYYLQCTTGELTAAAANDFPNLIPIGPYKIVGGEVTEFTASDIQCVDCRTRGSNVKPPFWP